MHLELFEVGCQDLVVRCLTQVQADHGASENYNKNCVNCFKAKVLFSYSTISESKCCRHLLHSNVTLNMFAKTGAFGNLFLLPTCAEK